MDATTERLVDFALRPEFSALPADTLHACKQHVIDTIASALGAYDEPLSRMARGAGGLSSQRKSSENAARRHPGRSRGEPDSHHGLYCRSTEKISCGGAIMLIGSK